MDCKCAPSPHLNHQSGHLSQTTRQPHNNRTFQIGRAKVVKSEAQILVWIETNPLHQTQEATKRKKSPQATTTTFVLENKLHVQFIMFIFLYSLLLTGD